MRALVVGLLLAVVATARAAPPPCPGCLRAAPKQPIGLLVVLHGDDAGADAAFADWQRAAAAAHLALFAPQCPRALGCDGSWWRWALTERHDPQWLVDQIAAAVAASGAPEGRVYLAGYSGGASYLASWAPAHAPAYPDVAYVSGGYPSTETCPAGALHALVEIGEDDEMRTEHTLPFARWLAGCEHADVTTRVIPHLGHHAMHGALRGKIGDEVVAWLLHHGDAAP